MALRPSNSNLGAEDAAILDSDTFASNSPYRVGGDHGVVQERSGPYQVTGMNGEPFKPKQSEPIQPATDANGKPYGPGHNGMPTNILPQNVGPAMGKPHGPGYDGMPTNIPLQNAGSDRNDIPIVMREEMNKVVEWASENVLHSAENVGWTREDAFHSAEKIAVGVAANPAENAMENIGQTIDDAKENVAVGLKNPEEGRFGPVNLPFPERPPMEPKDVMRIDVDKIATAYAMGQSDIEASDFSELTSSKDDVQMGS